MVMAAARRSTPDLPTMQEAGIKGYEAGTSGDRAALVMASRVHRPPATCGRAAGATEKLKVTSPAIWSFIIGAAPL